MGYCHKVFCQNCLELIGGNKQRIKAVSQCENYIATTAALLNTGFKLKNL